MNAVDTNVLVYFVDEHEPAKQTKARELLERLADEETQTVLLWQVAVEFVSCLRRWENEGRLDRASTLQHVEHLEATFPCVMPSHSLLPLLQPSRSPCGRSPISTIGSHAFHHGVAEVARGIIISEAICGFVLWNHLVSHLLSPSHRIANRRIRT